MSHYATSEDTRRALIHAAGELVADQGVRGVSTRKIAARAGQNIGSIHYHFGGKEGLLLAAAREAGRQLADDPLGRYLDEHVELAADDTRRAELVSGFVSRHFDMVFSSAGPAWRAAFCYQAIQRPGPLRDEVLEKVMDSLARAHVRLYRMVSPGSSEADAWPWAYSALSQVVFFAVFEPAVLPYMGWEDYPDAFLQRTRLQLIHNALTSLGLPVGIGAFA